MSQTWDIDLIVPASTSPSTDIQRIIDGFSALRSVFSGASEPASADTVAFMLWADTTTGLLKIRNAANTAWVTVGTMASVNLGLLALAGGNLTGGVNDTKTTVASATTPDIFATTVGNVVDYTGTTTATGFATAPQAGAHRRLICASASVFTAGANMLIHGVDSGSNFTAAAGVMIDVYAVTTTQFRLVPIVSGQWRFPATQNASSDPNTLDDYEEGTWTPSLGGTTTYNSRAGNYLKVGRLVYATYSIFVNTIGTGSPHTITGLPFSTSSDVPGPVNISGGAVSFVTAIGMTNSSTQIQIQGLTAAGPTMGAISVFGNSTVVTGCVTYLTAN